MCSAKVGNITAVDRFSLLWIPVWMRGLVISGCGGLSHACSGSIQTAVAVSRQPVVLIVEVSVLLVTSSSAHEVTACKQVACRHMCSRECSGACLVSVHVAT
jgi:hypothetical protein